MRTAAGLCDGGHRGFTALFMARPSLQAAAGRRAALREHGGGGLRWQRWEAHGEARERAT